MGLLVRRLRNLNLRNPLLSLPSPHLLTPLRSLLRQHLLPRLPHPRLPNALRPSLGDLRNDPRGSLVSTIFIECSGVSRVSRDGDLVECVVEGQD